MDASAPIVGVLALQGDFEDHAESLRRQGLCTREVRSARDLVGIAAIVLPGGESTTMLKLLDVEGLWAPLGRALQSGMPVMRPSKTSCPLTMPWTSTIERRPGRSSTILPSMMRRWPGVTGLRNFQPSAAMKPMKLPFSHARRVTKLESCAADSIMRTPG